ncbi:hypothetical protein B0T13DRAFT_393283, partial [Neurospora crassa]
YIAYPPYSLDLNPIEHVWNRIKRMLRKEFPELHLLIETKDNKHWIGEIFVDIWNHIPQDFINSFIDSLPKRLEAVRKAKGWYTKY